MKPCKHCGHVLADNARFCLFCMQRQEAPLSLVDPQFVSSFPRWKLRAAVGTATVALTGILSAVLITALSQINSSGSSALSAASSIDSSSFPSSVSSASSMSSLPSKAESAMTASSQLEGARKDPSGGLYPSASSVSESNISSDAVSSKEEFMDESTPNSSQPYEKIMTPQEMIAEIISFERKTMEEKYPNLAWTDTDLGEYSYVTNEQIYYEVKTPSEWKADCQTSGSPLQLAEATTHMLMPIANGGYGISGQYHWKILDCKKMTDDLGTEVYFFKIDIQRKIDEVDTVEYGIHTLSMIQNIRSELSHTGTRIDILPQYDGMASVQDAICLHFSVALDLSGSVKTLASNQKELEAKVVEEAQKELYAGCLYDIRFLYTRPGGENNQVNFYFALYVK